MLLFWIGEQVLSIDISDEREKKRATREQSQRTDLFFYRQRPK